MSLPTPPIVQAVSLGEGGILRGSRLKTLIDLSTTGPSVAGVVAKAAAERGVAWVDSPVSGGVGGCDEGHAGGDGVVRQGHVSGRRSGAQDIRQDVLRRREAGARADCQARQQPAGRLGDRRVVGGRGDGREGRPRRQDAHRHHQRRQRPQQRDAGQVPASRSSRARSTSASRPGCRTRTCACASTRPRRSVCPMVAGAAVRQMLAITQAKFGADSDFTSLRRSSKSGRGWRSSRVQSSVVP